jgi:hypothetical protein
VGLRAIAALIVAGLLLAGGIVTRHAYRHPTHIGHATLLRLVQEQPTAIVHGSIRTWGSIYGEVQHGVLPATPDGAFGAADAKEPPDRFLVVGMSDHDRSNAVELLRRNGFPPNNRNPGNRLARERGVYRALFAFGFHAVGLALLFWLEDRWRRGGGDATAMGDPAWWRRWRLGIAFACGLLVAAVSVFWIGMGASLWNMLIPMLVAPGLGLFGLLGLATGTSWAMARRRPADLGSPAASASPEGVVQPGR